MIKLVATDMDGTFLNRQGSFDKARLRAVLDDFAQKGILFAAASGRPLLALEKMFADYHHQMAFIAENGTLVKADGSIIFESGLSKPAYLDIIDTLLENPYLSGYDFLLSGEKGAYLHQKASDEYAHFISHYYENVQRVPNLAHIEDAILKVTANFSGDTVRQGEAWFHQRVDFARAVTTGFKSVDIIDSRVNKRTGLEALCQAFEIDSSEVLAFGDNLNDFEMMGFAGTAIATQNARPEIKNISDEVIGDCDEEVVMTYMERLAKP